MTPSTLKGHQVSRNLASFAKATNGFNTIRLIAATAVIFSHAFPLSGAQEPLALLTKGQTTLGGLAVAAFFLISGLLIPASLDRGDLLRFTIKRLRRIMPGLIAAVLICALILGPIATSLTTGEYLADGRTWRFIGNALFLPVGYDLPGVFGENPMSAVNGSLWSLKFEMACYIGVPILLAMTGLRKVAVLLAWLTSFAIARVLSPDSGGVFYYIYELAALFRFFGMGMVLYLYADRIPVRSDWGFGALALFIIGLFTPVTLEITTIFGSYALVVFAYKCGPRFANITAKGDISYGVYVYAFPIQQLLMPLCLSATIGGISIAWLVNSLLALPLVALAGLASWLWVEKPALGLRKQPRA